MIRLFLSTTAAVLALAAPAWAQTATDQPTTTPPPATEESGAQPTAQPEGTAGAEPEAVEPAAGEAIIPEQTETQLTAEDLMRIPVVGPGDEEIGKVEDLIFDEQEKITGVVVGVGGFLGIGKKEVGLDWDQAKLEEHQESGKRIVISLTKADLEAAPDFKTTEERKAEEEAAAQQQQLQQQQAAPPPATVPQQ